MNKNKRPKIVITKIPRWFYFQWFLLGFYELRKQNKIIFKIKTPFLTKLSTVIKSESFCAFLYWINKKLGKDSYNLEGYIELNNKKSFFVIDSADSPFVFKDKDLDHVDIYFKMQYPINIEDDYFRLNNNVKIPWLDHDHEDPNVTKLTDIGPRKIIKNFAKKKKKIYPLMIGLRRLSCSNSYFSLKRNYNKIRNITKNKDKNIFCYFGSSKGPTPEKSKYDKPDYDIERNSMFFLKDLVNHPNEKRKIISDYVKTLNNCESIVVHDLNNNSKNNKKISLSEFHKYVSHFKYNVNISGFRLSIPNRFIDSFLVDTRIFTDKLFVKWYLPFDDEVIETIEMGYLKLEDVNWDIVKNDINKLDMNLKSFQDRFEKKWSPTAVCNYIVDVLCQNLRGKFPI